jgi:hypothetical protein
MTTTSVLSLFNSIPKFDGTNWVSFKKDVEVYFKLEGNWGIISGSTTRPSNAEKGEDWDTLNERGYSLLYFLILPEFRSLIIDEATGATAWAALKAEFEKDASATRLSLRNQFYSVRHDPTKPVSTFIESVQSIARQLKAIDREPGKDEVEDIILLRLDKSYEPIRSALITREKSPKLSEIIAAVKEYGISQAVVHASSNSFDSDDVKVENLNSALASAYVRKRGSGNESVSKGENVFKGDFDWGNSRGRDDVCYRCGRKGHIASKCIADMPKDAKDRILSAHCAYDSSIDDDPDNLALFALSTSLHVQDSGSVTESESHKKKNRRRRRHRNISNNSDIFI